jgi:hypothetical protein
MLRPTRNRPRAFLSNLRFQIPRRGASVDISLVRGLGNGAVEVCMCGDEFAFAFVPIDHHISNAFASSVE